MANVLGVADEQPACLVLEWIDVESRQSQVDAGIFGLQLAQLHQTRIAGFGRQDHRTTGSQALPNSPCDTWPEFYATQRLQPLAAIAAKQDALSPTILDRLLTVADQLCDYGADNEPPAVLHGDLWAGNRLTDSTGVSWLIDPAAHGGSPGVRLINDASIRRVQSRRVSCLQRGLPAG